MYLSVLRRACVVLSVTLKCRFRRRRRHPFLSICIQVEITFSSFAVAIKSGTQWGRWISRNSNTVKIFFAKFLSSKYVAAVSYNYWKDSVFALSPCQAMNSSHLNTNLTFYLSCRYIILKQSFMVAFPYNKKARPIFYF